MRSAFFSPNSRAISRVPTFPGDLRMKATMASRVGKTLSRCFATYPLALPALFLAAVLAGLAGEVFAVAVTGARALLAASDLGLAVDLQRLSWRVLLTPHPTSARLSLRAASWRRASACRRPWRR